MIGLTECGKKMLNDENSVYSYLKTHYPYEMGINATKNEAILMNISTYNMYKKSIN